MAIEEKSLYKAAIVTGAARGIGREIALTLAKRGIAVGLCDISPDVRKTLEEIQSLGVACAAEVVDISNENDVERAYESISNTLVPIDVLVNNAGIGRLNALVDYSVSEWDQTFAVNVRGPFLLSQKVLPKMMEQKNGLIVNIASIWGLRGASGRAAYAASKHALVGMSKCLSEECHPYRVRVITLCPGNVLTDLASGTDADTTDWMHPKDVADVVGYLCEPGSRAIVRNTIEVNGWGRPPEFK
ncbi:SDR family NAD(P)-dependent oxidoreductase [Neobacillus niacini]|uniref:SDR family NAD(P)-dependent oxidoreductase n=1 Tax=Neobacillus niacini TaxID=86668 RepID=UPI0021CB81AC|nr:SDR family oxidoreductase [Neobacillus niacini]MCM3766152.1 SDR family oxidoreductase [Neobacillus niacini]